MAVKYINILSRYRKRVIGGLFCLFVFAIAMEAHPSVSFIIFFLFLFSFFIPRDKGPVKLIMELSALLKAGHTLVESIELLGIYQRQYKKSLSEIVTDLKNGSGFAESFIRRLRSFPSLLKRVIKEGEKSDNLAGFLNTYLEYYSIELSFKQSVKRPLAYPVFVFAVTLFSWMIVMIFVVPIFSEMYSGLGRALPLMTQATITIHKIIVKIILLVLAMLVFHFLKKKLTNKGLFNKRQDRLDALLLTLFTKENVDNSQSMGEALSSATRILGNKKYIKSAEHLLKKEKNGAFLLDAYKKDHTLPSDLITALSSANMATDLPKSLGRFVFGLKEHYLIQLKGASMRVELTAIIFNCILCGFTIISFYLMIFGMAI